MKCDFPILRRALAFCLLTLSAEAAETPSKASLPAAAPAFVKVLILSGGGKEDTAAWRASSQLLEETLTRTGRFEVRVTESPAGLTATALAAYDLVVDNNPAAASESAVLEAFVESGKGLVVTRNALEPLPVVNSSDPTDPTARPDPIRAAGLTALTKVSWPDAACGPFQMMDLKPAAAEHPIFAGLTMPLRSGDRLPSGLALQAGAEVLAASKEGVPLLISTNHGKGRVLSTVLGSDPAARQEPAFLTTLGRGAEWAATGKVTLPPRMAIPEPDADALRVLIITGGHDHEGSFYSLTEGYRDLAWAQVSSSDMAFKEDLRPKYDVIVFYDFSRDLDDRGRRNLQDFVAAGKGLVVLHHAVLSYQKWPWWSEEVVGGRYRLSHEGTIPNSTVKAGEEHFITAEGPSPITDGLTPFHVFDETYKGLWISPKIKPLLHTDNPTSDPVVGWIGPCTTSRVIYLQLGHDHTPFRHPAYRALVHRSILWTAGRLP